MKIAWCTPFGNHSAIARFSLAVVRELRTRGHDVTIVRLELDEAILATTHDPDEVTTLHVPADADSVVVNFGNHAPYHARGIQIIAERPALLVLHDAEMRDFLHGMRHFFDFEMPDLPFYAPRSSGEEIDPRLLHPDSAHLLQFLASLSTGCVTHGPHYLAPLRETCPGMVDVVPLCYAADARAYPTHLTPASDAFSVTIFGVLNPNKQLDRLLHAVALLPDLGKPVDVVFSGVIEAHYRARLEGLATELGIAAPTFTGRLSDQELSATLLTSDVICCLRMPVTEGGSASAVTAMHHARPLVVSDVGAFSMIPDEFVHKVSFGDDPHDLAAALTEIAQHPAESMARAQAGQGWANVRFGAVAYVDAFLPVLEESLRLTPSINAARSCAALTENLFYDKILATMEPIANAMDPLFF